MPTMTTPPATMPDYRTDCPTEEHVRELLPYAIELWRDRNVFIRKIRQIIDGENPVGQPGDAPYSTQVTHNFLLRQAVSEKEARFLPMPIVQAVTNSVSTTAREEGTQFEDAVNRLQYEMEVQGDGDVWARMIADAIPFDIGVERIEAAPQLSWPEFTIVDDNGTPREKLSLIQPFESEEAYRKYREDYKKGAGCPLRSIYVQPEMYLPIREGTTTVETFEVEERSLREVLHNKTYDTAALRAFTANIKSADALRQRVTLVHYSNLNWHAYFALVPSMTVQGSGTVWPKANTPDQIGVGKPVFLHAYQHGIGRVIYNEMGGRNGGWKGTRNRIEGVINALAQINQDADEISSQVKTNIRNVYWPVLVAHFDMMQRDPTDGIPKAPIIKEGQSISMWKGEELKPLFLPQENPVLQWFFENLLKQHERLSGSLAVYGQPSPGVDTGFHANLQVSQSEHLDDKLETAFVHAAIQRVHIICGYIRRMDEKLWVHHRMTDEQGRRYGGYIALDPAKLRVMPQLDAIVKRPRPIDYVANIRAAIDASADRHGPGTPLLDDDTIRERLLGEQAPDRIAQKILIQNERQKLLDSGALTEIIKQQMQLDLQKDDQRQITPDQAGAADPALLRTLAQQTSFSDQAAQNGGMPPNNMLALMKGAQQAGVPFLPGPGQGQQSPIGNVPMEQPAGPPPSQGMGPNSPRLGMGGGPPPGQPQPEQDLGKMLQAITRGV